jgi:two-component system NtrC family sensor kinase
MLTVEQDLAAIQRPVDRAIADGAVFVAIAITLIVATTFIATRHLVNRIDKANAQREKMSQAFIRSAKLASIGELATGLAHEINNPLAIISAEQTNIADILQDPKASHEDHGQALESVNRTKSQIQRCANITRKMLQFGRNEQSKLEPTDIVPRLTDTIELLKRRAGVRNVEITLKADQNLPRVLVDPIELEQVLVNLINNSIDALPDGGAVTIKAYAEKNDIHLEVIDNGVGIRAEESERIFEPFYTTKPVGKGTGLGLSVCHGIVQSFGGKMWVESEKGQGTTMHVCLPLHRTSKP